MKINRSRLSRAMGSIAAVSVFAGSSVVSAQPPPDVEIHIGATGKRVIFPELALYGVSLQVARQDPKTKIVYLEPNFLAYRDILARFGPPNDIYPGMGGQTGGFGVGGHGGSIEGVAAGTSAGASPGGSGSALTNPSAPSTSQSAGLAEQQSPEANVSSGDAGLVTWLYNDVGGFRGNTFAVTFDEQADGAVAILRYYGTNFASPVATTHGKIRLGATFADVLQRYGYPDMTVTQTFDNIAEYYFTQNVVFGFQGTGGAMRVNSITITPGLQPLVLPLGQGGTTASSSEVISR